MCADCSDDLEPVDILDDLQSQLAQVTKERDEERAVVDWYSKLACPIYADNSEVIMDDGFKYKHGGKRARAQVARRRDV